MSIRSHPSKRTILIVDDSVDDIMFLKTALEEVMPRTQVVETTDPQQTEDLVAQHDPDMIFVDLRMPMRAGDTVVSELRSDEQNDTRAVVILSSSGNPDDIKKCYRARANAYYLKPSSHKAYLDLASQVAGHWLSVAQVNVR